MDTAREPRCSELVLAQPADDHGALCEVVMSDADAHLARSISDYMVLAAATLSDKR